MDEKELTLTKVELCRMVDLIDDAVRLHVPYSLELISSFEIGKKRLLFTLDQLERMVAAEKLKAKKKGKK